MKNRLVSILKAVAFAAVVMFLASLSERLRRLPLPVIIGVGCFVFLAVLVIQFTIGFGTIYKWLKANFKVRPYLTTAVCAGILIALSCVGMYFLNYVSVEQPNQIVNISSRYYDNTLHYSVSPRKVNPDTVYEIVLQNSSLSFNNKVVWGENETSVRNFEYDLTPAQVQSLSKNTHLNVRVYELQPEQNIMYLAIPVAYILLCASVWWANFTLRQHQRVPFRFYRFKKI